MGLRQPIDRGHDQDFVATYTSRPYPWPDVTTQALPAVFRALSLGSLGSLGFEAGRRLVNFLGQFFCQFEISRRLPGTCMPSHPALRRSIHVICIDQKKAGNSLFSNTSFALYNVQT
jgi:hypothetical protein